MRLALEADEDDSGPSQADAMFVEHLAKQLREDKLTIKDRGNPPPSRRHTRGRPHVFRAPLRSRRVASSCALH